MRSKKNTNTVGGEAKDNKHNIVMLYVSGQSAKLDFHCIAVFSKLIHTKNKRSYLVAAQCCEECTELFVVQTKQLLKKNMVQHRRANSSGRLSSLPTPERFGTFIQGQQHT